MLSTKDIPIRDRLSVTVTTAAQFSGISRSRLYEFIRDGHIEARLIHGRRLIMVRSLIRFVEGDKAETDRAA